jgi:dihydrofolate reductase
MIKLIVAMTEDGLIGNSATNSLPWNSISGEMSHFRATTLNHCCIFGRKTFEGLPKRLDQRQIVVLSRKPKVFSGDVNIDYRLAHIIQETDYSVWYFADLKLALKDLKTIFPTKDYFICGGLDIYKLALDSGLVDEAIVSYIKTRPFAGDIYFPANVFDDWSVVGRDDRGKFEIVTYRK